MIGKIGRETFWVSYLNTQKKTSSFSWNFHLWLHWELLFWQFPGQPMRKTSSKWQQFRFNEFLSNGKISMIGIKSSEGWLRIDGIHITTQLWHKLLENKGKILYPFVLGTLYGDIYIHTYIYIYQHWYLALLRRHNGRGSVSNHHPHDCLLNCLFRRRSKKTSKLRVTGLCAGNSPVPTGNSPGTGELPAQMASNAENVSIWWRHHEVFQNVKVSAPACPRLHIRV